MNHDAWAKLDAYLDGALAAEERWAVAAHLNECAACRQYLAEQARLREMVRGHVAAIEVPPGLDERLRAALAAEEDAAPRPGTVTLLPLQPRRLATLLGPIAAGLLLFIWSFATSQAPTPSLKSELVVAHALFAQDTSKLDVLGDAEAVSTWFRDEAGLSVSVPEIDGYLLAGGRLMVVDGQPVAQLVYRSDPDGLYLSLLRFKDVGVNLGGTEERDGFAVGQQGPTSFVTWAKDDDRTVLIGESPLPDLRSVAADLSGLLGPLPTVAPIEIRALPSSNTGGSWLDYPR